MTNPNLPLTNDKRIHLARVRLAQQQRRRKRILETLEKLTYAVSRCSHARDMTVNEKNGCISFRYNGKRVQYWAGVETLLIRNAIETAVYRGYPHMRVIEELNKWNAQHAFRMEAL